MFNYLKVNPTEFVIQYRRGKPVRKGAGMAFFYFRPNSTISIVPIGSVDVPFIYNEVTKDFQEVTVQGQLTYRISDPELVASLLDYSVGAKYQYRSEDPAKMNQRLVNLAQVTTRAEIQARTMRDAIHQSQEMSQAVLQGLSASEELAALGVEMLIFNVLAVKPTPEIARALEAEARELLLRQADDAIYDRRNSAVEQERRIKENELNTEISVEEKQRQIRETKVEADKSVEQKTQEIREIKLSGQISLEEERKKLIDAQVENAQKEADAEAYAVEASLKPLQSLNADVLQVLALQSGDPRKITALAFKELAENAAKIGNLNISPELLDTLMRQQGYTNPPNRNE